MKPKITISIEKELIEKIRSQAEKEGRTVSNMIRRLVERALKKESL